MRAFIPLGGIAFAALTLFVGCSGIASQTQLPLVSPTASYAPAISTNVPPFPTPTPTATASATVIFR